MYEIIVKETKQVTKITGKDWTVVSRQGEEYKYDYTPEIEKVVMEERTIYRQEVDDLDLAAVIIAVNKLREVEHVDTHVHKWAKSTDVGIMAVCEICGSKRLMWEK